MSKNVVLKATKRTITGKQVSQLRRQGQLPGVIYGSHMEPINISLEAHNASLTIPHLTASSIVTIDVEGKEIQALVREKQRNYIKGTLLHVDFLAVSASETIRAYVPISQHGLAPAVKDYNAVLVTNLNEVEVEALPKDLPERFDIDLSSIKEVGDAIYLKDLSLPAGVQMLHDVEDAIVVATGAAKEEVEIVEGEVSATEPELVERKKKDEVEEE